MATLKRPDGLGDAEWAAIREAEDRLLRAKAASDPPLVVGSAKELCEAIAKVVITERGGIPGSGADMPEIIATAHKLLEFQPGEGLASDPETRKIAQGLKSIVLGLGEMRNRHGTGHGRPAPTGVADEHADLAFDASLLWGGWALRRLEPYIAGDVTALVRDLEGEIFSRGDLSRRLKFANLPLLPVEEQMRLGVAVARRASAGTFVVREDGIEAVQPDDPTEWPLGYVEGLVAGLFFDINGYLDLKGWKVRESARLISALPDSLPLLNRLAEKASIASSSYGLASDKDVRRETIEEFQKTVNMLPEDESREVWFGISRSLGAAEVGESESEA